MTEQVEISEIFDFVGIFPETEATRLDTKSAGVVEHHELARTWDNQGESFPPNYAEQYQLIRTIIVECLAAGVLYSEDGKNFEKVLLTLHELGAAVYPKPEKLTNIAEFRSYTDKLANYRKDEAETAAQVAQEYADPYQDRFKVDTISSNFAYSHQKVVDAAAVERAEEIDASFVARQHQASGDASSRVSFWQQNLPFISPAYQVIDKLQIVYPATDRPFHGAYEFTYPPTAGIKQYLNQANTLGMEIYDLLSRGVETDQDKKLLLEKIAQQYQYLVTARPFEQINNSLFMSLVNAQLKVAGFEGISHGELDTVAQRLTQEAFIDYFKDYCLDQNRFIP